MRCRNGTHLTYCTNIHPGESWEEVREAVTKYAAEVKSRVCPASPFGLGLRLSARAASELLPQIGAFRESLEEAGMYVFTVNGFPYGRFHGAGVKEGAYQPDWSRPERLAYTVTLARLLAHLLPDGCRGTISTLPVAGGKDAPPGALENISRAARSLAELHADTGREVVLALEPEPGCFLETTEDSIRLWDDLRARCGEDELPFLGVCLDTCHAAVIFERPADSLLRLEQEGIPVPKVQISSALQLAPGSDPQEALGPFADPSYLHQTRIRSRDGMSSFRDLPEALQAAPRGEWRVHFHVPLHFKGKGAVSSTSALLDEQFFSAAVTPGRHIEIETYSFGVLPGPPRDVVDSICSEFGWLGSALLRTLGAEL